MVRHKKAPALSHRGLSYQSMNGKRDYLPAGGACPPGGAAGLPLPQPGVVQTVTSWM